MMRKSLELLLCECRLMIEWTQGGYRVQASGALAVLAVAALALAFLLE